MKTDMFDDCRRRLAVDKERKAQVDRLNAAQARLRELEAERVTLDGRIRDRIEGCGDDATAVEVQGDFGARFVVSLGPRGEVQLRKLQSPLWPMFIDKPAVGEAGEEDAEVVATPPAETLRIKVARPLPDDSADDFGDAVTLTVKGA